MLNTLRFAKHSWLRWLFKNPLMIALLSAIIITGCKKNNHPKDDPAPVTPPVVAILPDSVMFVSTLDTSNKSPTSTTIYLLNASRGDITTKYHLPYDRNAAWCYPAAGNGFLYHITNSGISAMNMTTGSVLWKDTVDNLAVPVLHNDIFYGISRIDATSFSVYALDATKQSKTYLWKYQTTDFPGIKYYNGVLYVQSGGVKLAALDAKTGALKWQISTSANAGYSLNSINYGVITTGNTCIDATTGTPIGTVNPTNTAPAYGPGTFIIATPEYATKELYIVRTSHFPVSPGLSKIFLSAVDRVTGAEKWRIDNGGGQVAYDTVSYAVQPWNNQLIMRKVSSQGAGKYGVNISQSFWVMDINTGAMRFKIVDVDKGATQGSYIVGNNMYFYKKTVSTLTYPFNNVPLIHYLFATDLLTGKQKWNNDKILDGFPGYVATCVFTGGKGYSPFIQ